MDLRGDDLKRTARAPAKLNLFLQVLGRRADGFHDVENVMVPVRLADQVTFRTLHPAAAASIGEIQLEVHASFAGHSSSHSHNVPTGADNLIARALELLQQKSGSSLGARIKLFKRIPVAAGLGG